MKRKLLFCILSIFYVNNIFLVELNQESLINHHENAVTGFFEVWKIIDIVKAIKATPENRKHFCNELIDSIIILYSDVLRMSKQETFIINKNELDFILELFNNIRTHFFDVFYDVDTKEFLCITLILDKIEQVFKVLFNKKFVQNCQQISIAI